MTPRSLDGSRTRAAGPGNQLRLSRELRRRSCAASEVVFAVEEERFTRVKHAKQARVSNPDELPWNAIRACLEFVPDSKLSQVDAIAYSLAPGPPARADRCRSLPAR